jgi:KDO2-lipid IV(A) lauroyltransferase
VLSKRGSLDAILERLAAGDAIVFPFDQHAGPPDGIAVDFFGHAAWTFKSLAILALSTGAPVVPAASWREPDGRHVLRFEEPIPPIEGENAGQEILRTTRAYNAVLERLILRHPEQWYWVHRRWKEVTQGRGRRRARGR